VKIIYVLNKFTFLVVAIMLSVGVSMTAGNFTIKDIDYQQVSIAHNGNLETKTVNFKIGTNGLDGYWNF
jgi:hypothetical protein